MRGKESPQSVIEAYQRRQRMMPRLVAGLAILLAVVGVIILVVWFTGSNRPAIALFASATPTATSTFTPTATVPSPTPTETATPTLTPTITMTATPTGPFEYVVQEQDTCWDIAAKYKVDLEVLLAINNFPANSCPIAYQQKILIPLADMKLPTPTDYPIDAMTTGQRIKIIVRLGDSLAAIAARYQTTVDAILAIKDNNLTDANQLVAGQELTVPVKLITPVPTKAPTVTATPTIAPTK